MEKVNPPDIIDNPPHYTSGREIQPLDVIDDWELSFDEGQVLKYLARWRKKNGIEDLCKARFYLNRLINSPTPTHVTFRRLPYFTSRPLSGFDPGGKDYPSDTASRRTKKTTAAR